MKLLVCIFFGLICKAAYADTYFVERPTLFVEDGFRFAGDSQFFTHRIDRETLHGWSANGRSFLFTGSNPSEIAVTNTQVIQGQDNTDFHCGAWMKSIIERDDGSFLGLFHGERDCVYDGNNSRSTHNTFFAESFDQGRSFIPLSGEGVFNVVIEPTGGINGIGNATMVEKDGVIHIYAVETEGPWEVIHATADVNNPLHVSVEGVIGPISTGSSVTWVGNGDQLASSGFRSCQFLQGDISGPALIERCPNSGILLSYISNFNEVETLPISLRYTPYVDRSNRDSSEIISAPGIVPINGGNRWYSGFYLMYGMVNAGDTAVDIRRVRRRVARFPSENDTGLIRLSTYTNGSTYRTTTDLPTSDFRYLHDEPAYLWTSKQSDTMVPVYEVYARSLNSYPITRWVPQIAERVVRVLGWVETTQVEGSIPMYATYDRQARKHGVSFQSGNTFLGYVHGG